MHHSPHFFSHNFSIGHTSPTFHPIKSFHSFNLLPLLAHPISHRFRSTHLTGASWLAARTSQQPNCASNLTTSPLKLSQSGTSQFTLHSIKPSHADTSDTRFRPFNRPFYLRVQSASTPSARTTAASNPSPYPQPTNCHALPPLPSNQIDPACASHLDIRPTAT